MILGENTARRERACGCASRRTQLRARRTALVSFLARDDVDDAADCVRSVKRRTLRPTNHLDARHCFRIESRDKKRICDLDPVHIDLRITHSERAGPANAAVTREQTDR